MERSPFLTERIQQELAFADVSSIVQLRGTERAAINAAMAPHFEALQREPDNLDLAIDAGLSVSTARAQAASTYDELCRSYLDEHMDRADNPLAYDKLLRLFRETAIDKMDTVKWLRGDPDDNGKYTKPETSGISLVRTTLEELRAEMADPSPSAEERKAEYRAARDILISSRDELAKLSVQSRQKLAKGIFKKNRELTQHYNEAKEVYQNAVQRFGVLKVQRWREEDIDDEQLLKKTIDSLLDEQQYFTRAELKFITDNPSTRNKIILKLANRKGWFTGTAIGMGLISGAAARAISKSALALGAGIAAPAALAGAIGIRTTRAILSASIGNKVHLIRNFEKTAEKDANHLKDAAGSKLTVSASHEDYVAAANQLLSETIDGRVTADRRRNNARAWKGIVLSAGSAALAEAVVDQLPWFHHGGGGGSHHPVKNGGGNNGTGGGNTAGNGGGKGGVVPPVGPAHPAPQPGVVDGYQSNVHIAHGEGYQQAVHDLAAQKHIDLSDNQSWQLYEHLNAKFHGNFFSNDPSYRMPNPGEWGISHAGAAHWNPAVIHEMNRWMIENGHQDKLSTLTSATKKVTKHAAKAALAAQAR